MKEIRRRAESSGWKVEQTSGGHLKFISPLGPVIYTSSTPSDRRAVANIRAMLRRSGLDT